MKLEYYRLLDDLEKHERWGIGDLFDDSDIELESREFKYGKFVELGSPPTFPLWNSSIPVAIKLPLKMSIERFGTPLDFTFSDYDVPVVTMRTGKVLSEMAARDIQRVPVMINSAPYEILNIITRVSCIDKARSEIEWFESGNNIRPDLAGKPSSIRSLYIDSACVGAHHIFRVDGWEVAIIISASLKSAFESANVTGIKYLKVSP